MKIFDTHAHYFDMRFERELAGGADEILSQIMPDPVSCIVNVATNCENAKRAIAQAAQYEGMYAAIGIHPEDCHRVPDVEAELDALYAMLKDSESRKRDKIVALGEIGLDYHWPDYDGIPMDKNKQAYVFERQMDMARELRLPVIIHDREAHGDCFDMALRHPSVRGVFHSFSGSADMARELVRRRWYVSFSGVLTFKNARRALEVVQNMPLERLMVETDAPYMAPEPFRGKRCDSTMIRYMLEKIAELRGITIDEASAITTRNAKRFFGIE